MPTTNPEKLSRQQLNLKILFCHFCKTGYNNNTDKKLSYCCDSRSYCMQ